ncbi:MAG: hypothetical protein GWP91_02125 [Rhodobacterales bacterium]|nr:hypothetical protein [Rhodobacterales bacterium]
MTTATTVRFVADAIEDVARWRAEEEGRQKSKIVEVDDQLNGLTRSLEKLQQQLEALKVVRVELAAKQDTISDAETLRLYGAIFEAIGEQQIAIEERGVQLAQAESERLVTLEQGLVDSDLGEKFKEYRQFKESVEPVLAAMPASYRGAIEHVHNEVAELLRERIAELLSEPVAFDGDELMVEVVFGVDSTDGRPELLIAVTPVHETVHSEWAERGEDLQTRVAIRTVQGVLAGCKAAGLSNVQLAAGGHLGLLAIEVDLQGAVATVGASIQSELAAALNGAAELRAAKMSFAIRQVEVDHLLPPEEDDAA